MYRIKSFRFGYGGYINGSPDTPHTYHKALEHNSVSDQENREIDTILQREKLVWDSELKVFLQSSSEFSCIHTFKFFSYQLWKSRVKTVYQAACVLQLTTPDRAKFVLVPLFSLRVLWNIDLKNTSIRRSGIVPSYKKYQIWSFIFIRH